MKLTDENQDEQDSRPLGRTTGHDAQAFETALAKVRADRAKAATGDRTAPGAKAPPPPGTRTP